MPIFNILFSVYNKKAFSCTLCSVSANGLCVAVTGAETTLYKCDYISHSASHL